MNFGKHKQDDLCQKISLISSINTPNNERIINANIGLKMLFSTRL